MSELVLSKYSMGIGDRFGQQGEAQLAAFVEAAKSGIIVSPVWNKSNREHQIVHTEPSSVRAEADSAVKAVGFSGPYHVDADHISIKTVDRFLAWSDFFTLDVADYVGQRASDDEIESFVDSMSRFIGTIRIPGIDREFNVTREDLRRTAEKYLLAVREAGNLYRHIGLAKGSEGFITEVSMDETDQPQSPLDLLFILAAIALHEIPAQTIAPKFTGRFNKGVDYVGELQQFEKEFNEDLAVIAFAIGEFGLPGNLKLSVHSGSDKFSIYPVIRRALARTGAGLHLKTAGTTWLEELIGLAEAGGEGLEIAHEIYAAAYQRFDELCRPYATVIDIDQAKLPTPAQVSSWSSEQYVRALRHDRSCPQYDRNLRQLLHLGYKVAAEMGQRYLDALARHREAVARNVTYNILERHLRPIFGG